ncbi:MAG: hypothetical protein F6K09_38485 [Merismopedia sp. SIO2A8]|nr:hypothetical protein [Symploca sp. SIO2B6]NET54283.1 hypothetical protein [Merismopedia sp. SIO2A8]
MSNSDLRLNLLEGSVSFKFSIDAAKQLKAELSTLTQSLKVASVSVGSTSRPERQNSMEYQYTGDVFLELFCNPNIWSSPFAAKVLLTLRDDRIRLSTEAELTRVIEDLNEYLEQNS